MSEPAINSRKRTAVQSSSDLPPPRQGKAIRSVSPPLSNISMHRFNYYLAIFAALMFALYTYRLVQWKSDAGGWWNLALGKRQPAVQSTTSTSSGGSDWQTGTAGIKGRAELTVEERINELASALGMPSKDLASAIAGAIREYVPPATLSSISAHQTGEAISYLVDPDGASASEAESTVGATANKGFHFVASAVEAAVGMDEPPTEMA